MNLKKFLNDTLMPLAGGVVNKINERANEFKNEDAEPHVGGEPEEAKPSVGQLFLAQARENTPENRRRAHERLWEYEAEEVASFRVRGKNVPDEVIARRAEALMTSRQRLIDSADNGDQFGVRSSFHPYSVALVACLDVYERVREYEATRGAAEPDNGIIIDM